MKNLRLMSVLMGVALAAAVPAAALAQSGETPSPGAGITNAQGALDQSAPAEQANAEAEAKAKAEARAKLDAVLERGAKEPAKLRTDAETKIHEQVQQVNDAAAKEGEAKVAGRLGGELGMTADEVLAEKQALGASWGELMIAHTLKANAGSDLTVEQIYQMKKEGGGWGQIAAGMGLKLGDVVSAARAEGRVAAGLAKGDGKVHPVGGVGAAVRGGVGAKGVGAGVKGAAGADVKVKPGKP